MSRISIDLEAKALIPTLLVYREYFDTRYPCSNENNDGNNMPPEDEIKYQTYNYLLAIYEKNKNVFDDEYKKLKEQLQ